MNLLIKAGRLFKVKTATVRRSLKFPSKESSTISYNNNSNSAHNTHELYYLQRILYGGAKEVIYKDGY